LRIPILAVGRSGLPSRHRRLRRGHTWLADRARTPLAWGYVGDRHGHVQGLLQKTKCQFGARGIASHYSRA